MAAKPQLSEKLTIKFAQFLEYTPPSRLNMNLRRLLMNYLICCNDAHGFNMDDLLLDLANLMELLDVAGEEMPQQVK